MRWKFRDPNIKTPFIFSPANYISLQKLQKLKSVLFPISKMREISVMEEVKRWRVTYTKHVKQKRKVYQDGFLQLRSSTHKIVLYDECENVLDSRFVTKDDVIQSGEAIAFNSYLVDIDHLEGDHKPIPNIDCQMANKKIDEKPTTFRTRSYKKGFSSPVLGKKNTPSISLSPSQKIIRDFIKKETIKYKPSPSLPDTSKSTEWEVLYTTQVTQKAKKRHDGFLQLVPCGSHGRQIMLYDETRRLLNNRFLKKDEVIKSGESVSFDGHLVDIGECATDSKPLTERDCNIVEKTGILQNESHPPIQPIVEFDVMYTVLTAKKYQYGILRLVPCGSYQTKATLLSEEGNILTNVFLKSSSHNVRTGTTLQMLTYSLEIGELRKGSKGEDQDSECNSSLKIINLDGKSAASGNFTSNLEIHDNGYASRGVCHYEASPRKYESSVNKSAPSQALTSARVRAASEILNFIKRPVTTVKEVASDSSSSKECNVEGSHSVHSEEKILKEDLVQDSKCQPNAMHCPSGEVINIDSNECNLKVASLSKRPGSSNLSGAAVTSSPRSRGKCLDSSNWMPTSPLAQLQDIRSPKLDSASKVTWKEKQTGQLPGAELCVKSTIPSKDAKVENIEQCADLTDSKARRDEASGVGLPVQITGAPQSPFVIRDVPSEQDMAFWKMDDAPSFDLGF